MNRTGKTAKMNSLRTMLNRSIRTGNQDAIKKYTKEICLIKKEELEEQLAEVNSTLRGL